MNITTINPISDDKMVRKSSIYQHNNLFSVMKNGEWCPILFDKIDGIECGVVKKHKVALRLKSGLNYTFPVGTCHYVKDTYYTTQKDKIELRVLPEYYGTGFYNEHVRQNVLTNVGNNAFGHHQEKTLRIGKDYAEATTTLKAVD